VFSIDHGVAFAHNESDRGELWKVLRVDRLPADAVQRLRTLSEQDLESRLAVLAQWQLRDGQYVAVPPAGNVAKFRGVRLEDDVVQLGLTGNELRRIWRQRERLLKEVDNGKITTF
jgi:Xaa-Pro aminopeptidase